MGSNLSFLASFNHFRFFFSFFLGGGGAEGGGGGGAGGGGEGATAVHSILRGMNKLYENIIVISEENKTFRSLNATEVGTLNDAGTF